jgi:hypothetical protein
VQILLAIRALKMIFCGIQIEIAKRKTFYSEKLGFFVDWVHYRTRSQKLRSNICDFFPISYLNFTEMDSFHQELVIAVKFD